MIKVVLADDHAVVRHGLRFMLEQRPDIQVVGECGDGKQALEMVTELLPDVALFALLAITLWVFRPRSYTNTTWRRNRPGASRPLPPRITGQVPLE